MPLTRCSLEAEVPWALSSLDLQCSQNEVHRRVQCCGHWIPADCSAWITGNLEALLLWTRVSREAAMLQVLALLVAAVPWTQDSIESAVRRAMTAMEAAEQWALGS